MITLREEEERETKTINKMEVGDTFRSEGDIYLVLPNRMLLDLREISLNDFDSVSNGVARFPMIEIEAIIKYKRIVKGV